MNNIAIIITTFLRDELLNQTIQTIIANNPNNYSVLIGDQNPTEEKIIKYSNLPHIHYFDLPFDCGLSFARNCLVDKAKELNCNYCLISADSIQFLHPYNFNPIIEFLASEANYGLVGFELLNSKCPWEYYLEIKDKTLIYTYSDDYLIFNQIQFKKVDICRNIFLAKTNAILNLWDNEMKLSEHTLAFLNLKNRGYKVFWTDYFRFNRLTDDTVDYRIYRNRAIDYKKILYSKLKINQVEFIKRKKNV